MGAAAVSPVETYGLGEGLTWQATDIEHADGMTHFKLRRNGELFGRFASPLLGLHNVRNALAAIAVGVNAGLGASELAEGLRQFKGIKRRLETVGVGNGVTVLDDFAHHPTAVLETLSALRTGYPARRIWAVFEPRSASSCRRVFQKDFARAFGAADEVVVAAVFRSALPESERLSAPELVNDLCSAGQRARHIPEVEEIISTIVREHRDGDIVVLMSNGGFGGIHKKLLQALAS
jgi:UDP-N-acetylmuramate: L-alanyl-gamma-D-glutamyl-meso-diaminopimelate ligase